MKVVLQIGAEVYRGCGQVVLQSTGSVCVLAMGHPTKTHCDKDGCVRNE